MTYLLDRLGTLGRDMVFIPCAQTTNYVSCESGKITGMKKGLLSTSMEWESGGVVYFFVCLF